MCSENSDVSLVSFLGPHVFSTIYVYYVLIFNKHYHVAYEQKYRSNIFATNSQRRETLASESVLKPSVSSVIHIFQVLVFDLMANRKLLLLPFF